ncbi:MAG: SUMF1/EgtB/PvdO family nonheme iron enzyme [Deltaproteobacteria bacterium]|nr:SUMF1/EgtB/PvdO family nonheme iron enzyme [Deltaproteobacteria bacterium]
MSRDSFGLVGSILDGNYRVEEPVGEGGFGVVYRAHQLSLDRPVVVKCLKIPAHFTLDAKQRLAEELGREGRHVARLADHPAMVVVYDYAVAELPGRLAVPYLALEWLEGHDLETELGRRGAPYPEREAVELLRPAVEAVALAHARGIVHRDIKPANLFLAATSRGRVLKVLDFGVAKAMQLGDEITYAATRTATGFHAFSPQHGAPEQFRPKKYGATGPWTDVHGLGLVLVELVSGRPALDGEDFAELMLASTAPARPTPRARGAAVGDAIETLCARALAVEPRERLRDAGELLAALDARAPAVARTACQGPSTAALRAAAGGVRGATEPMPPGAKPPARKTGTARGGSGARRGAKAAAASQDALPQWAAVAGVALASLFFAIAVAECPSASQPARIASSSAPVPRPEPAPAPEPPSAESMVLVPAGDFWMGCAPADPSCDDDEKPRHEVYLDAFYIDKTEVTVAAYRACVSAGGCGAPGAEQSCNWGESGRDDHPINCVDWHQSEAYCRWTGKRLPTEAEWEKAARSADGRIYPWGSEAPSCRLAVMNDGFGGCGRMSTWPVGSKPAGASPYGALDMAGNVWEWVADWYDANYYATSPARNPGGPTGGSEHGLRGGCWQDDVVLSVRASDRIWYVPALRSYFGFRCARPAP